MPFTPFIGISVIVHICVIFGCWLFSWIPTKEKIAQGTTYVGYAVNSGIIVAVFMLIFIQAGFLVHASIVDKHSSVKFFASSITQIKKIKIPELLNIVIASTNVSSGTQLSDNPMADLLIKNRTDNPFIYQVEPVNNFNDYNR